MNDPARRIRDTALDLLARREHSRRELERKLISREHEPARVTEVLDALAREGLQSDERYTESYLRGRIDRGYGPLRLAMELRERGIDDVLIESCMDSLAIDWMDALHSVRKKKFGANIPADFREQARQSRFLQYRGFTTDQIRRLYRAQADDE